MQEFLKGRPIKVVTLDLSGFRYLGELHLYLKEKLGFPDFYGENLNALWDCLWGFMYVPAEITIIYHPKTKGAEELREEVEKIVGIFRRAEKEFDEIIVHVDM